jgi:hypothetical protein
MDNSAPVDLIDVYFDLVKRLLTLIDINLSSTNAFKTAADPKPSKAAATLLAVSGAIINLHK